MPTDKRASASTAVHERLAELLGTRELDVRPTVSATDARLGELTLVSASPAGEPNRVAVLTVDEGGEIRTRAELAGLTGRDPFLPRARARRRARPGPAELPPVTIDPRRNDWVLDKCATARETITVTVPESGATPKADVYLLADTTGSMSSVLASVAAASNAILTDPVFAAYDVAWGVGNYRDFPVDGVANSYAFVHQLSPTTTVADATAAVGTWTADEGSDGSEGQLYALEQIATDAAIGWRTDAKRILVWMGDAPGHDPICPSLTGLGAAITEASATAALTAAAVTVVAIGTSTGFAQDLDDDPMLSAGDYPGAGCDPGGSAGQATRIAAATGGSYTSGLSPDDVADSLVALIETAVSSVGNVRLVPTGETAEFVESITPASGYGPLPGDTEHLLTFEVAWRGTRACRREPQELTGAIDVVADGVVVASKPVRVTVPACRYHYPVTFVCGPHPGGEHREEGREPCTTLEPGHYATLVTIYNPSSCPVVLEKRFAPIQLDEKTLAREPDKQPVRRFAKLVLEPGEVTMDDCCALREAVGDVDTLIGVLDLVADGALEVTATLTTGSPRRHKSGDDDAPPPFATAPGITSRTVAARMAP